MKKFTFYLEDDSVKIKVGDKLPLTVVGKAPNLLIFGVKDKENVDITLCSDDPNDQNYLEAEKLDALPDEVVATVLEVNSIFGMMGEVIISIDELEDK